LLLEVARKDALVFHDHDYRRSYRGGTVSSWGLGVGLHAWAPTAFERTENSTLDLKLTPQSGLAITHRRRSHAAGRGQSAAMSSRGFHVFRARKLPPESLDRRSARGQAARQLECRL
jgi:hypothetical protein